MISLVSSVSVFRDGNAHYSLSTKLKRIKFLLSVQTSLLFQNPANVWAQCLCVEIKFLSQPVIAAANYTYFKCLNLLPVLNNNITI